MSDPETTSTVAQKSRIVINRSLSIQQNLREKIWNGKVPILFCLAEKELISKKAPTNIFLLLPRISYLPLVTETVFNHFNGYAPALSDGIWFEDSVSITDNEMSVQSPLKWNFPIGVLYDLYCNPYSREDRRSVLWQVTVHFQSYPSGEKLAPCEHISCIKDSFFNCLKQSALLAYNSISVISVLKKDDQNQMWNGVRKANYDLYFPIFQSMFSSISSKVIRYPMRIILKGFHAKLDLIPIQRQIPIDTTHKKTFNDCLSEVVPGIMLELKQGQNICIIINGMKVPLSTPMLWLIKHCCYADLFLYVVIVKISGKIKIENPILTT